MGGEIWLESELGVGTTFSFTLPLELSDDEDAVEPVSPAAEKSQILLIDDNPGVIRLVKSDLDNGIVVSQGPDALEIARDAGKTLNLIVLDALLKGTDSFELLNKLNTDESTADVPVLMGAMCVNPSEKMLALDVVDYLVATASDEEVLALVRSIMSTVKAPDDPSDDRVLIVHGDAAVVERLKTVLADTCGCHVERAFNSRQAMDMVVSKPDLILSDVKMPGEDGGSVITQLRRTEETKNTPIVAVIDHSMLPGTGKATMLGISNLPKLWPSFSAKALVAESGQIGHNIESEAKA
jgi:CheY-like chemotaxis protein